MMLLFFLASESGHESSLRGGKLNQPSPSRRGGKQNQTAPSELFISSSLATQAAKEGIQPSPVPVCAETRPSGTSQ